MRRRTIFGSGLSHEQEFYGVPCANPDNNIHQLATHQQEWGDECWICLSSWADSLPWHRSGLDSARYNDDGALFTYLRLPDELKSKPRFSVTYNNVWNEPGVDGYISELFGIELGESKDPDSYPYYRLNRKEKPNVIIPVLRQRICYGPQIKDCPIFLEVIYKEFRREINWRGLDTVEDISTDDLKWLLRVIDLLHGKEGLGPFDDSISALDSLSAKARIRLKDFITAAERLAQNESKFSILKLCNNYGWRKGKAAQSRDLYYKFLSDIKSEGGAEKAEMADKVIREAFATAKKNKKVAGETTIETVNGAD
ncbi:MAG TPA: hypothetical protein VJX74_14590 [Blastocatellia bacterium]|nr:hypothetical protein [Blastocatellia bacterium]